MTVEKRACGGALERVESRVCLERLGEVLGALRTDAVSIKSVSEGGFQVSAALDSREKGVRRRT